MSETIAIVGGGPAGLSCARSYRDRGGTGRVVIFGADSDPPYERPALTKEYLRGESSRRDLPLEDASFYVSRDVELRTGAPVESIDLDTGVLGIASGEEMGFSACVLAMGSRPALPPIDGAELAGVATMRWIADSDRLRDRAAPGKRLLVVGSGFVGCEAAISAAARGADVTLATMESGPQAERLGDEVSVRIRAWLEEAGVEVVSGVELESIAGPEGELTAAFDDEREIAADSVLLALGVERNSELAADAGIELSDGRIPTDERLRTSHEGIYAVGDLALARNAAAERRLPVEHWGEALRHGEIAGAALAGDETERWENAPGFWSGLGERVIKQAAWGDGYERVELTEHEGDGFTARYIGGGKLVGVLAHEADDDYERGKDLVEAGTAWS